MAYEAPKITSAGLSIPTYDDMITDMMERYYEIFGSGAHIDIDAADYEWMSILAKYVYDGFLLNQLAYTNRSPSTVIGGEPQDSLYTINGIRRKDAGFSTAVVTLTGEPRTIITNGVVKDVSGNLWDITSPTQIGIDGTIDVTATAQRAGRIIALPGDINEIHTPVFGWHGVTNPEQAVTGSAVETDSEFRERRLWSVANPSQAIMEGIVGAVAAVPGVTRYKGYENDTGATDDNGIPGHTISMVVEGGDKEAIGNAIYLHKTPGCGTYGDQSVIIYDRYLIPSTFNFFYASYQPIEVTINILPLLTYTEQDVLNIQTNVKEYLDTLDIGENVLTSMLIVKALEANVNMSAPTFSVESVTIGLQGQPQSTANITTPFNTISTVTSDDIVVNVL